MKTKTNYSRKLVNRQYFINLNSIDNARLCINRLGISEEDIISTDINDRMQLVITTNEMIETSYTKTVIKETVNESYKSVVDYLNNSYVGITCGIIKSMYNFIRVINNNTIKLSVCYEACKNIVNNHYINDPIFEDLCQETYIFLFENMGRIVLDETHENSYNNLYFSLKYIWLDTYKNLRKYLYNQSQKQLNKNTSYESIFIDSGIPQEHEKSYTLDNNIRVETIVSTRSNDYKKYSFETLELNYNVDKLLSNIFIFLYNNDSDYKPFMKSKIGCVFYGLASGMTLKEVSQEFNISINSVTKYKKMLVSAWENYKNNRFDIFEDIPKENAKIIHDYMCIDLSKQYNNTFKNNGIYCYNEYRDSFKESHMKVTSCNRLYRKEYFLETSF